MPFGQPEAHMSPPAGIAQGSSIAQVNFLLPPASQGLALPNVSREQGADLLLSLTLMGAEMDLYIGNS